MRLIASVCRSEKRGDTERHDDRENRREFLPIVRRKVKMFKQEKEKKRFNAFLLFFDPSEKQPLSKQVQKLAAKKKKSTFVKKKKNCSEGPCLVLCQSY